jgi:regulator of sigma E protease
MDQILQTLIKYGLGILGVGTIVILHEFGHFIAAHLNGIDVEIFSLGFGPRLFGKQIGKTEYRLSLIPFGGYCRLKGSDDLTRALDMKAKKFEHIEHGSLFSVHPINKLLTYIAGPLTNVIISIFLCIILASLSYPILSTPCYVAPVTDYQYLFSDSDSPAGDSGIIKGDKIRMIDNTEIRDYQAMASFLSKNEKQDLLFTVERKLGKKNTILQYIVSGSINENGTYRYGLSNILDATVASVRFFSPESKANLKKKDKIIAVNKITVSNNLDLLTALHDVKDEEISLTVLRDSDIVDITYTPDKTGDRRVNKFSLYSPTRTIDGMNFTTSITYGTSNAFHLFTNTVASLLSVLKSESDDVRQVFTGPMRASLMIGDITIMGFENNIASGLRALCYLLAVVSISIAIANLLPLPAFDGGQILIAFLEAITRKRISPSNYWRCQLFGMICVILIFAFLYFIDIRYFYMIHFGSK